MNSPASLNHKEIDRILEELQLPGCKIQEISQPYPEYLILELFGGKERFKLLMVFKPGYCRLHRLTRPLAARGKPQRFVSFLRAHIRNGIIREAAQVGDERIVRIRVVSGPHTVMLWARFWSTAPNLIAADEHGTILDALFRRPARGEVSGGGFSLQNIITRKAPQTHREYSVRELPGTGDFNARVEEYFFAQEQDERIGRLKDSVTNELKQSENRLLVKLENIEAQTERIGDYTRYKEYGDIIMGLLSTLHKGDRWCAAADFYHGNSPLEISLDVNLTPAQNAEHYYHIYKKKKQEHSRLRGELERSRAQLEHIRTQMEFVSSCSDAARLSEIRKKRRTAEQSPKSASAAGLRYVSNGFTLIVGRNARENEALLRHAVRGNDYWLHSRDYPGSYVFIKSIRGKSIPLDTLLDAGNLALSSSKAKKSSRGHVYYTQVKYLKKVKGAKAGLVIPTHEKNLLITLDAARLKRLKDSVN
jgi:predicted ribosome quality control (RQC) complex YloA/Tae2 family protein